MPNSDNLNDFNVSIEPPTLYEVLCATQDAGLVGEADTVLTVVLAMIRGNLIVMTGPSRAGKDACVDAAESVYNADETVYRWPADDSETAAYYNRDEINQYPVHRFPDLARLEDHHEKVLKAFGEGRDAERNRTDVSQDEVEDQVLKCPDTVIAFIASDNKQIDLDDYPELRNRALTLPVDASEEQTSRVNERKAREHAGKAETRIDPLRRAEIQQYHQEIPVNQWTDSPGYEIINPAALEVHNQEPIPEKFPEARQDFERLLEFMETVALYHYAERLTAEVEGIQRLYVAPTDIWEAMTVIGNKMVMSALNLDRQSRAILELLNESMEELTKAEIQQALRAQGYHVAEDEVRDALESMRMKGYIRVHQNNVNTYTFNEFGQVVYHDAGIDYQAIADAAGEVIYDVAPDDRADIYTEEFCHGDGLITTHPFTGEAVDILEDNTLETMMDEGIRGVEEVFDDDDDSTEPDDDGDGAVNATLT